MKLTECNLCEMCKIRECTSFSKGAKEASVLFVFGYEPRTDEGKLKLQDFIRKLNVYLHRDFHYSFVIKCYSKSKDFKMSYAKKCSVWLKKEIERVDPYLIVLMGNLAKFTIFGGNVGKHLQDNVFYIHEKKKDGKIKRRQFFVGNSITANKALVNKNVETLTNFIKGFYNGS